MKWEKLKNGWFFCCIPKNASTSIRKHRTDHRFYPLTGLKIAVIRHPLDRLVSCFENGQAYAVPDFKKFCEVIIKLSDDEIEAHAKPQHLYLDPFPDKLILFEDVGKFFEEAGMPLETANKSDHKEWETYYDEELKSKVENRYAEDLRIYNELKRQNSA